MIYDAFVGVDFGQANDYTAVAVIEQPVWVPEYAGVDRTAMHPSDKRGWVGFDDLVPAQVRHFRAANDEQGRPPHPPLHLRHLERTRHVSYQVIVEGIAALLARPPLAGLAVALLVDHTGVGRGVLDWLAAAGLDPIGITITGGDRVNVEDHYTLRVPKRDMIVATQAALQTGRLRIASGLPEAETLVRELTNYRVKISDAGHDSYDARQGEHDDTVLAVALAVWYRDWSNHHYDAQHAANQRPRAS